MPRRNVTTQAHDPRERFGLYRLCDCPTCEGSGKEAVWAKQAPTFKLRTCHDCRGEGRIREEVATCETPEAVGVALVTLAREGEWTECPFGLLDRMPSCKACGGSGDDMNWLEGRTVSCRACKGSGVKPTATWLILPWLPSARNVRDAARTLGKEGARKRSAR